MAVLNRKVNLKLICFQFIFLNKNFFIFLSGIKLRPFPKLLNIILEGFEDVKENFMKNETTDLEALLASKADVQV